MDWNNWIPRERATLCFIIDGSRVLLIRKLRGLGAGKINGPGGKIEPGETPLDCAIRETMEEVAVAVPQPELRGELSFEFVDGYRLHCYVYLAFAHSGTPKNSSEAEPFWVEIEQIPFAEMWQDDRLWLGRLLAGEKLRGRFVFDGDEMISHELTALTVD